MKFGSVCSGIEAASVAWEPLGWEASWFAEVEAFPSAVLAHHWPNVMNHGDMLALPEKVANENIPAPDVLVGGTPCQAFSVAGRRGSLSDERGALTLAFVELANAIDNVRHDRGDEPCTVVWENVPGVLNTKDNAFGCFLGALAGESCELQPAGKRWTNAGCVFGPKRAIAWRVLDAQYFGVAQRRRRVFVVASARDGFDPAAVLFEREGVRRDSAPSRETGQAVAALTSSGAGTCGADDNQGQAGHLIPAKGCWWDGGQVSQTLDAVLHKGQTMPEKNRFPAVLQPVSVSGDVSHTLKGEGCDASEDGTGRGTPIVAFDTTQITHPANRSNPRNGDACHPLAAGAHPPAVAIHGTQDPDIRYDHAHTLGRNSGQENAILFDVAVRRLTPIECERLQGFRDGHTMIPTGKRNWSKEREDMRAYLRSQWVEEISEGELDRLAADGPRYKAIGNSMAVPVMNWIGRRISMQIPANDNNKVSK